MTHIFTNFYLKRSCDDGRYRNVSDFKTKDCVTIHVFDAGEAVHLKQTFGINDHHDFILLKKFILSPAFDALVAELRERAHWRKETVPEQVTWRRDDE